MKRLFTLIQIKMLKQIKDFWLQYLIEDWFCFQVDLIFMPFFLVIDFLLNGGAII